MTEYNKLPYEVGYKKPPKTTQFERGRSGNPKGRRKGTKNFATVLQDELKALIVVTEGGKRKKISKREAIAKQLVNKAATGDPKAIPIVFNETRIQENLLPITALQDEPTPPEDHKVMASIISRIRAAQRPELTEGTPSSDGNISPKTEPESAL